jgi:hypothetical protein
MTWAEQNYATIRRENETAEDLLLRLLSEHDCAVLVGTPGSETTPMVVPECPEPDATGRKTWSSRRGLLTVLRHLRFGVAEPNAGGLGTPAKLREGLPAQQSDILLVNLRNDPGFECIVEKVGRDWRLPRVLMAPRGEDAFVIGTSAMHQPGLGVHQRVPDQGVSLRKGEWWNEVKTTGSRLPVVHDALSRQNNSKWLIEWTVQKMGWTRELPINEQSASSEGMEAQPKAEPSEQGT